jgi:hypothetical protein
MKIFIWGTGYIANQILDQCNVFNVYDIIGFIDNNPQKKGSHFRGIEVFEPDILNRIKPDKIVILTDFFEEIKQQIIDTFPKMKGIIENKNFFYREIILTRYKNVHDSEIKEVLEYIQRNDIQIFNYDFVDKYRKMDVDVQYNPKCKMFYVYHQKKKLYFAQYLDTEEKVRDYYLGLLIEQDEKSPHRYLTSDFNINEGDVVVDVGVAEGNFSLEIIERASKIYMIEAEHVWADALKETFKEYQEKVIIVKKYITSINKGKYATLDELIDEPINFIKMDIEGNEWDGLLGAERLFKCSKRLKCAICAYHSNFDEILIKNLLKKYNVKCSTTSGYMWWPFLNNRDYMSTRLCRGIVRGIK